jgi:hypothetical protein
LVQGACQDAAQPAPSEVVPSVSGSIPVLAQDGRTTYYVQVVCTPAVKYSGSVFKVNTPTASIPSIGLSLGAGGVDVQKTTLQQATTLLQALDLAQFNACRDAVLRPGNTDSAEAFNTMSKALVAYAIDLQQARSDAQMQAANHKASAALDPATPSVGATIPVKASEPTDPAGQPPATTTN